jgi:hypothetical protein
VISKDVEEWGTTPEQIPFVVISLFVAGGLLYLVYKGNKIKMPANQGDLQA